MEKIINLGLEKFGELVAKNETLRTGLYDRIYDDEMWSYLQEKLDCFEGGCINYEFAPYCYSYMRLRKGINKYGENNAVLALYGIEKSAKTYGCSESLQKRINQCLKLNGTNLFEYHVENLLAQFFKEEIMYTVKWLEDMSYQLSCGKMPEDLLGYLECFQDDLGNYYYNEDTDEVFQWKKCS